MADEAIPLRKKSHLDLCVNEEVEHQQKTTLFEEVELVHEALPDLDLDQVDPSVEIFGKRLRAPLLITGMTGGTPEARDVNRDLARLADDTGIAFGLGSQRAMHVDPGLAGTYRVRDAAPTVLLFANVGLVQAAAMPPAEVEALAADVGADAVCIHLNPAQEMIQPEGDRGFAGTPDALARLVREVRLPVIVKETGCGISGAVGRRLEALGVRCVDVSGAGGTSWVRVEQLRGDERGRELGELFRDWGIPTAAALFQLRGSPLVRIASGGIRTPLDVVKALALGARLCGFALPVLRAYQSGGVEGARAMIERTIEGIRVAMLLLGRRTAADLEGMPVVIGPRLEAWGRLEEERKNR